MTGFSDSAAGFAPMARSLSIFAALALALVAIRPAAGQEIEALPDPLVVQLNERAARGGAYLGESINAFARIGEWKMVDRWLAPLAATNDESVLVEIADHIGPAILLRISGRNDLSQESIQAARKLGMAARKQLESQDRIVAAVKGLGGTTDQRLAASRVLLSGGDTAVAALVSAVVAPQPTAPRDDLLRTLVSLGDGGQLALTQLALYGEPQTRARALEALVRIDPRGSSLSLLTALHAADSTAGEVQFAETQLQRLTGSVPGKRETQAVLFANLKRQREIARLAENNGQTTTLWSVTADRNAVAHQRVYTILSAYRDGTDAGARLRRIGDLPPRVLDMAFAADISYRVMVDSDWGDTAQINQMRSAYGSEAIGSGLSNAIATAIDKKDYAAAVGLMRMVDGSATVLDKNFLLSGKSPRMTPLVQATTHSNPRIRYEAASAIARLAPTVPFAGGSNVKRCFAEMRSLTNRPIAVMVETRPDVIVQQEQIISDIGFDVRVVHTVGDLEREVARGAEIELIVSKTQLADLPPIELIDRVRRMPRGRYLPIIFFGAEAEEINTERWDAVTRVIEQSTTPPVFSDIIIGIDRVPRWVEADDETPPLAILVENRDQVIERQEPILEELGYTVTNVKSLESLDRELATGGEIQLIAAAVNLPNIRTEQLVDIVRRRPIGKGVLIALYRESIAGYDAQEWNSFQRRVNYPNTGAAYASILEEIEHARRLPPLTGLDRQLYRDVANQALSR